MPRRYFHRKDANQDEIVKALRDLGLRVHIWGEQADLIVQWSGITMLCEVRQPGRREARKGRQQEFQKEFQVYWLQTTEDCAALKNTLQKWYLALALSK